MAPSELPYPAFVCRIHFRAHGAVIISRKIFHVAKRHDHPVLVGGVFVGYDQLLELLLARLGAPDGGRRYPKHLTAGVINSGKHGLFSASGHPSVIS